MSRPDGPLAWLHAASVGESVSILPVLVEMARQREDVRILVTTGSVASAELLMRLVTELGLTEQGVASLYSAGCAKLDHAVSGSLAS